MQTFQIISIILNIGLLTLVLSLGYPKLISNYKRKKKQREIQALNREKHFIRRIVLEYLDELKND